MDQINSQVQFSESENLQHDLPHSGQAEAASNGDVQDHNDHNAQPSICNAPVRNTSVTIPQNQYQYVHPNVFFYRPSNGFYHYHVVCKEISYNTVTYLLNNSLNNKTQSSENEYSFFYQQQYNNRFYQVTCEIVSPSLVTSHLNETFHGIEPQHTEEENLVLTSYQKENLEYHLTRYLSQYLLD